MSYVMCFFFCIISLIFFSLYISFLTFLTRLSSVAYLLQDFIV